MAETMLAEKKTKKPRRYKWLRRAVRRARYRVEYGIFLAVVGAFRLMGLNRASAFGGWLLRTVGPLTKVHKRGLANLQLAMPELSDAEREEILTEVWDSLGRTTAEYPFLTQFEFDDPAAGITLQDEHYFHEAQVQGRGVFLLSGHSANWEVMLRGMGKVCQPGMCVYRSTNNPHINHWLLEARKVATGLKLIDKNENSARSILQALRKKSTVGMLVDQKIREGARLPFFGHPALTTTAPALFAIKVGAPILPAWIERTGPLQYRLRVLPPIEVTDTGDLEADTNAIMTRMNAALEACIRERPGQWLWLHDRWGGPKGAD